MRFRGGPPGRGGCVTAESSRKKTTILRSQLIMNHLFAWQNKHRVSTRMCFHYFLISFWAVSKAHFHPWTGWWLTCPFPRQGFVPPPKKKTPLFFFFFCETSFGETDYTVLARSHLRTAISNMLTWHSNTCCPHWSTLVSRRGNWVVTFPCSVKCSVDLSLSSGDLWLSQTMTRHFRPARL